MGRPPAAGARRSAGGAPSGRRAAAAPTAAAGAAAHNAAGATTARGLLLALLLVLAPVRDAAATRALHAAPAAGQPAAEGQQSSRVAYLAPSLGEANPANHTFTRLAHILEDYLAQYDLILLLEDVRVESRLFQLDPLRLTHNLTISSADFSTRGYRVLELEFLPNRLLIPQGMRLTLKDIAIGRARKSSGQGLPFFAGEGEGSLLVLDNAVRVRSACAKNEAELLASLSGTQRPAVLSSVVRGANSSLTAGGANASAGAGGSSGAGNASSSVQQVGLVDFTFRGVHYTGCVHATDFVAFVTPGDGAYAGYLLAQLNTTRVCESYVPDECVAKRGGDVCVMEAIDSMLAAEKAAAAPTAAAPVAAIAAPVAVGGVLLLTGAAAAVLLLRRRQRRRSARAAEPQPSPGKKDPHDTGSSEQAHLQHHHHHHHRPGSPDWDAGEAVRAGGAAAAPLLQQGWHSSSAANADTPGDIGGVHSGAAGSIEALAVGSRGGQWRMMAHHTSPEFSNATPNDRIRLGVLLGAGSFGRVYKGVFHNLDVAVKVLQHDTTTAAAISNEVDLVMSFRHRNIVAAFHFVTWTRSSASQQPQPGASAAPSPSTARSSSASALTHSSRDSGGGGGGGGGARGAPAGTQLLQAGATTVRLLDTVAESRSGQSSSGGGRGSSGSSLPRPPNVSLLGQGSTPESGLCLSALPAIAASPAAPAAAPPAGAAAGHASSSSGGSSSANSTPLVAVLGGGVGSSGSTLGISGIHTSSDTAPSAADQKAAGSAAAALHAAQPAHPQQPPQEPAGQLVPLPAVPPGPVPLQQARSPAQPGLPPLLLPLGREGSSVASQATSQSQAVFTTPSTTECCVHIIPFTPAQMRGQQAAPPDAPSEALAASPGGAPPLLLLGGAAAKQPLPAAASADAPPPAGSRSPRPAHTGTGGSGGAGGGGSSSSFGTAGPHRRLEPDEAQTWLILEYCDGGTLLDLLTDGSLDRSSGEHVQQQQRRMAAVLALLADVAAGMAYLHARNVLHGDLKPGNVLIKHELGAPYGRVAKVSDFGLSRALGAGQSHRSTRTHGTLNHAAPELLRLGRLSPAVDVYAFGILMWELYTGTVAFTGLHYGEVFEQVALLQRRPDVPADMPQPYAVLMAHCWAPDPFARPSFASVQEQLEAMLASLLLDEAEAQERFVADL